MFQKIARAGQTTQVISNLLGQAVAVGGGNGGTVGGWVEVGRTTLVEAGDTIDVSGLPDKQYYMILRFIISSGDTVVYNRLNNDGGENYASRSSENGGTDGTSTEDTSVIYDTGGDEGDKFDVTYISNIAGKEKLAIAKQNNEDVTGADNAPVSGEFAWKWSNTSDPIDQIETLNTAQSGSYDTGSEVVVLGWDPDDTHTTNFWEELASVDLSGGASTTLSSGTISAKKYLWVQFYGGFTSNSNHGMQFNNDTEDNYATRRSINGGSSTTFEDESSARVGSASDVLPNFSNIFIVNYSGNEKLGIAQQIGQNTADVGTSPNRREDFFKWANTSSQITEIDLISTTSNNMTTNTIMKVWGHD